MRVGEVERDNPFDGSGEHSAASNRLEKRVRFNAPGADDAIAIDFSAGRDSGRARTRIDALPIIYHAGNDYGRARNPQRELALGAGERALCIS
jgi:hypothetical protein